MVSFGAPQTLDGGGDRVAVGDFDGDGHLDVIAGTTLHRGLGGGNFGPAETIQCDTKYGAVTDFEYAVTDFDQDGDLDFVGVSAGARAWTCLGDGKGHFGPVKTYWFGDDGTQSHEANATPVGDFDGDGNTDVGGADPLHIALGDGVGGYAAMRLVPNANASNSIAVDLDRDGLPDFIGVYGPRGQPEQNTLRIFHNVSQ